MFDFVFKNFSDCSKQSRHEPDIQSFMWMTISTVLRGIGHRAGTHHWSPGLYWGVAQAVEWSDRQTLELLCVSVHFLVSSCGVSFSLVQCLRRLCWFRPLPRRHVSCFGVVLCVVLAAPCVLVRLYVCGGWVFFSCVSCVWCLCCVQQLLMWCVAVCAVDLLSGADHAENSWMIGTAHHSWHQMAFSMSLFFDVT